MRRVRFPYLFVASSKQKSKYNFEDANRKGWTTGEPHIAQDVKDSYCCDKTCQCPVACVSVDGTKCGIMRSDRNRRNGKDISGPAGKEEPGYEKTTDHRDGTFQRHPPQWVAFGSRSTPEERAGNELREREDKHATKEEKGECRASSS